MDAPSNFIFNVNVRRYSKGFKNWTALGAEQYCDGVNGTVGRCRLKPAC